MDLTAGSQKPCPHLFAYIVEALLTANSVGAFHKVPARHLAELCRVIVKMGPQVYRFGANQGMFVDDISNLTGEMEERNMGKLWSRSHVEICNAGAKDVCSSYTVRTFLKGKVGKLREMADRQESRPTGHTTTKIEIGNIEGSIRRILMFLGIIRSETRRHNFCCVWLSSL